MMTPTTDYNQQMLAYLSTWQRLLEQWTTMAMGLTSTTAPIMPPAPQLPQMPFMPPFPPGAPPPPASTDYAQQLFSSLQAWRQHLEQMATGRRGVTPTAESGNSAQGGPAQPTGRPNQSGHASQSGQADQRPSDVINLPPINDGTRNEGGHEARDSSNPTPPPWIRLGTRSQTSSMEPVEVPGSPTDRVQFGPVEMSELKFPARQGSFIDDLGQRLDPEIQAPSAFREAMGRVDPNLSPQSVQKSLFAIANEPAANIGDAGQTPSP